MAREASSQTRALAGCHSTATLALLGLIVVLFLSPAFASDTAKPADAIFVNGDIYTQATPARAQAIAISQGRIVAVGSNAEILKLKQKSTVVVDLGGHFVMPGFNDAHVHLASGGFSQMSVDLRGTQNLQEMQHLIGLRVIRAAPGEWIQGSGWDHTLWPGQTLPTRQDIDRMTNGHPAIFVRVDGHIAIANSAALQAAGVTAQTPSPAGGKIDHDAQGEPTGILREGAQELVFAKVPPPTPEQRRRAAELALANAAQWGITSAQDNSDVERFPGVRRPGARGQADAAHQRVAALQRFG